MLHLNAYLIKQHAALMKLTATYDIFDPKTNKQIGVAKEEPSGLATVMRLFLSKKLMPTTINIYESNETKPLFSIYRGVSFFRSKVLVRDADNKTIGYFKSKLMSLGGGFWVYDNKDQQFAEVKGDWKGWNFKFLTADGQELGTVSKKWAGMAKEFFTSADNYVIALNEERKESDEDNILLLAAGLAIDTVFKERG